MIDPEFLARIPLFAALPPADRETLAHRMHERHYQKGAIVYGEGDPGDAACFVREGRIKVYRLTHDGQQQLLGIFGAGEPFGLVAAVDSRPFPATAEAADDCRIWVLRREDLQQLMATNPGVLGGVMGTMTERLRLMQGRLHSLAARSLPQRLAEYLLEQARRQGVDVAQHTGRVRIPMTHQELGAYLAASRETVTRTLADLRREQILRLEPDDTFTMDLHRLRELVE